MSKILYACFRNANKSILSRERIASFSNRLEPETFSFSPAKIVEREKELLAIYNPDKSIQRHGTSVCLGSESEIEQPWWKLRCPVPDGSQVLLRANNRKVEVLSQVYAPKTIWYYFDKTTFLVATSQQAILLFLDNFKISTEAIPLMLAHEKKQSESIWTAKIRELEGKSSLVLNRFSWNLTKREKLFTVNPIVGTGLTCWVSLQREIQGLPEGVLITSGKQLLPN